MKIKSYFIVILLTPALLWSCKKDNYKEPESLLKGQVVYKGQPLNLRSNGVQLELWQHGFELFSKIPVYIAQDGSFSASLFDGDYKLTFIPGNGPWVNSTDSIDIHLNGTANVDAEVTPYFNVTSVNYSTANNNSVTATVTIEQIANTAQLDNVALFIGRTSITDAINNDAAISLPASTIVLSQPIVIQLSLPSNIVDKGHFFARIGVKNAGVSEYLYSAPQEVQIK